MATPIGNLADISARALTVLRGVNTIAAEDKRVTRRLLDHHGIVTRLIPVHEHNEAKAAQGIVALLAAGHDVALVSDAGTPAISDPGARLVAAVREAGYAVSPIPGASAAVAAVSASGLTAPHFLFYGFLPARSSARRAEIEALAALPHALVFYEAPHRVAECVADLARVLGGARRLMFARELTKLFEECEVCTLHDAPAWLAAHPHRGKGEFVLVVEGAGDAPAALADNDKTLLALLEALPLKQAVALALKITGGNRNALYRRALALKKNTEN